MKDSSHGLLSSAQCLSAPGDAQTLKAGYISKDLNYLPFFIAQKKVFTPRKAFRSIWSASAEADIQLQALVAGELHFANINADNIIIWNERTNGNLKVAAGSSNAAPYLLIGAKHIKKMEDLKGSGSESLACPVARRRSCLRF